MSKGGGAKTVEEIRELKAYCGVPFIIKGVMTVKGALKALDAGADAVIVSNHGGRVLSDTPATAEVLGEIADAVQGRMKVLVDGGIRSGLDVFKALALGADACLICRPVLISFYGGGKDGVSCYFSKIRAELEDTMLMCGAHSIAEISRDMIRLPASFGR
jgi:isopentenyl diphosphate isomerase/L-lactate dehydrogenase-like FMN-dependent dehydrogenase